MFTLPSLQMSESQAIAGCGAGSEQAFETLYHLHKRKVYTLCLRMVGNVNDAEDFTQEAFMQVFRRISTFRGESAFSTWLHRVTVNLVLTHLRKKGLDEISLDQPSDGDTEGPPQEYGRADLNLVGIVDRVVLEKAIADLPKGYRRIFVLHDIKGYEHNKIAEMIGCSVGNSKSQLHKARMKLRAILLHQTLAPCNVTGAPPEASIASFMHGSC